MGNSTVEPPHIALPCVSIYVLVYFMSFLDENLHSLVNSALLHCTKIQFKNPVQILGDVRVILVQLLVSKLLNQLLETFSNLTKFINCRLRILLAIPQITKVNKLVKIWSILFEIVFKQTIFKKDLNGKFASNVLSQMIKNNK